jgi:eukaryotic-like serine/threonine-protein kinase
MDADRDLLFGVVALQKGAVDADRLAETCAVWVTAPTLPLADLMVDRGLMTDEKRIELEKVVALELEAHGGDPHVTLAAALDAPAREAIGKIAFPRGHVVMEKLSPSAETRNRYTLTHLHARGGIGQVWLARDKALDRLIALKELRPDQADNSAVCARFLHEAKITAQLEHPGIVPVYELGAGETPYYTMRFVKGRTLSEAIHEYHKNRATCSASSVGKIELLTAFVGICHAVNYAHSRGIIHRDLKGQNVALGDFGEVVVLDWGLAKRIGPDLELQGSARATAGAELVPAPTVLDPSFVITVCTNSEADPGADTVATDPVDPDAAPTSSTAIDADRNSTLDENAPTIREHPTQAATDSEPPRTIQGHLLGTPGYMAPEQAMGRHDLADQRTDVYGLGAILYEILTGRPPFVALSAPEIIIKICHVPPTPPRRLLRSIEPALEAICLKALSKSRSDRYPTAADLAQEVQRWLADEPVRSYAEPWPARAWRWGRRHRTAVAAVAALLITATIALALSYALISIERNEAEIQGLRARRAVTLLTKVADIGFDEKLNFLQQQFLEGALAYYAEFTSSVADDPAVRLEHGKAYQQTGNFLRMLRRMEDSESAYRKSIEFLRPLAAKKSAAIEPKRALARTRTLLADLLVGSGRDQGEAEPLYREALEAQDVLAAAPTATADDQLHLGLTLKSQGDLLRLSGHFAQAKPVYAHAITVLEKAHTADPKQVEVRIDLALATDARGWIHRELGDVVEAEHDFVHALTLWDTLLAESPTGPRFREAVARVCNNLALIEQATGRLNEAEAHLRRELPMVERLSSDCPDRPEYVRELARTWINLGNVLSDQGRREEAEPALTRAVELNRTIAAANPRDVEIRLDLSKSYYKLGELEREKGEVPQALKSFTEARSITEKLVAELPGKPRYREALAGTLTNMALAQESVDPGKAQETYQTSISIYEQLISDYSDNVDYRIGMTRSLANFGSLMGALKRADKAEALYGKALAILDTNNAMDPSAETLRQRIIVLNNLGELQLRLKRPKAENTLCEAIGASEKLAVRESRSRHDRRILARVQANLGELMIQLARYSDAGPYLASSKAGFESLVAEQTGSIDSQSCLGIVMEIEARLLRQTSKPEQAKIALDGAIAHQRRAVELSRNGPSYRELLGSHLLVLAHVDIELGRYDEAGTIAIELPTAVPASQRPLVCVDAARILARVIDRVGGDGRRQQAERDRLTRSYCGRLALFLREAIDADAKLVEPIKTDADIKQIASHPEFRDIINSLVHLSSTP